VSFFCCCSILFYKIIVNKDEYIYHKSIEIWATCGDIWRRYHCECAETRLYISLLDKMTNDAIQARTASD